jgi:hypothetical protein
MAFKSSNEAAARAHKSWAQTENRDARTRPGLEAARRALEDSVDPDRRMSARDRAKAIKNAQQQRMRELSMLGVAARQRKRAEAKRRRVEP